MKKLLIMLGIFSCASAGCTASENCTSNPDRNKADATVGKNGKILVVYFSRKGHNYPDPNGAPLKVGNTARIAAYALELTGGDAFEIVPAEPYPDDYNATVDIAADEKRRNARPAMANNIDDIGQYDVVLLGYPNWWGTVPMIVHTFLENHDLKGKTVAPFATHHGSGLGSSVSDLRKALPASTVTDGLAVWDTDLDGAKNTVAEWLRRTGIIE